MNNEDLTLRLCNRLIHVQTESTTEIFRKYFVGVLIVNYALKMVSPDIGSNARSCGVL